MTIPINASISTISLPSCVSKTRKAIWLMIAMLFLMRSNHLLRWIHRTLSMIS